MVNLGTTTRPEVHNNEIPGELVQQGVNSNIERYCAVDPRVPAGFPFRIPHAATLPHVRLGWCRRYNSLSSGSSSTYWGSISE